MRRSVLTCLPLAASLMLSACDNRSPSAPSVVRPPTVIQPPPLLLGPGPATLMVLGGLTANPASPPCTPPDVAPEKVVLLTRVILSQEGGEWVARPQPPVRGDLELRFRDEPDGRTVSGTVRGSAESHPGLFPGRDTRAHFTAANGAPATLAGNRTHERSPVIGLISGEVRFTDAAGAPIATCPRTSLALSPGPR